MNLTLDERGSVIIGVVIHEGATANHKVVALVGARIGCNASARPPRTARAS